MDYEFNSSDMHFPDDEEIPKLSAPMSQKVPQGFDWAYEDFNETFNNRSTQNLAKFMTLTPRIKVTDNDDDSFNFGPVKKSVTTSEEKRVLSQLSPPLYPLDRREVNEILKQVLTLVQEEITDPNKNNFDFNLPALSWREEVWDDGNAIGPIDDFAGVGHKLNNNNGKDTVTTFDSSRNSPSIVPVVDQTISEEDDELEEEEEERVPSVSVAQIKTKPLPALPVTPSAPKKSSNKGFKSTLSFIIKPFKSGNKPLKSEDKPLKSFYKNTKKTVSKLFKKKTTQPKEK